MRKVHGTDGAKLTKAGQEQRGDIKDSSRTSASLGGKE